MVEKDPTKNNNMEKKKVLSKEPGQKKLTS